MCAGHCRRVKLCRVTKNGNKRSPRRRIYIVTRAGNAAARAKEVFFVDPLAKPSHEVSAIRLKRGFFFLFFRRRNARYETRFSFFYQTVRCTCVFTDANTRVNRAKSYNVRETIRPLRLDNVILLINAGRFPTAFHTVRTIIDYCAPGRRVHIILTIIDVFFRFRTMKALCFCSRNNTMMTKQYSYCSRRPWCVCVCKQRLSDDDKKITRSFSKGFGFVFRTRLRYSVYPYRIAYARIYIILLFTYVHNAIFEGFRRAETFGNLLGGAYVSVRRST